MADALAAHAAKRESLRESLRQGAGPVALAKETSNLFRDREAGERRRLDVRGFNQVLQICDGWVEAEGMIAYDDLTRECLARGVMPAVVPQLKTITLGGAVAGVGIEASSHRYGLVHDTMLELDVLLGDGRVVSCTPDNAHADLFFGFPSSYGTLGYALRVKARTVPVKRYVQLAHLPLNNGGDYFSQLEEHLRAGNADFVDGTIFSPERLFITLGRFVDSAPFTSDYTYRSIYYRSIAEKREDYLSAYDYIWRWDTDWFWCSKNLFAQNPVVRRIYGRRRLGSRTYAKIMRWNSLVGLTRALDRLRGLHAESVIDHDAVAIDSEVVRLNDDTALRGDDRDIRGGGKIEPEMHLFVDFLTAVNIRTGVGKFRFDLRVAKLLKRVLEEHLGGRFVCELRQVLIVLLTQLAIDLQKALQQIVRRNVFVRCVRSDCGNCTAHRTPPSSRVSSALRVDSNPYLHPSRFCI